MALHRSLTTTAGLLAGCLAGPTMVSADGYSYPIVVERAPAYVEEAPVQLGDTSDAPAPIELTVAAPEPTPAVTPATPAAVADAKTPDAAVPVEGTTQAAAAVDARLPSASNGGTASAGFTDSGRTLSVYGSDKVVRVELEQDTDLLDLEDARLSTGVLISELRDTVFTGTLKLDTFPGLIPEGGIIPRVKLSVGTRLYVALLGQENRDVFGVGFGASGSFQLPIDAFPLSVGSSFYYTPDILAFGQSDRIFDWSVDAGLRIRDNLSAFVGFRFLQFDTRPGSRNVEDDLHLGFTWHLGGGQSQTNAASPSFQ